MPGSVRGVMGRIEWGHYPAAAIYGYTVAREGLTWTLQATVVQSDAFKLTQRPLTFVALHRNGEWRWPVDSLELNTATGVLSARLGPPAERT